MRKLMIVLLVALSGLALAASLQEAKALFVKGDFQEASKMAAGLGTADGFVLAAKANSIYASTRPDKEYDALYSKSEEFARRAIKLDEKGPEGYFELARAIGRLSQARGVAAAILQGLATIVKENLEKTLDLNPKHAGAMVALGLWHVEVSSKGAGWLYGADAGKAPALFEAAIKLEPDTIVHRVEYAKALLTLDKVKNKAKAIELLEAAIKLKTNDAAEALDLERAKKDLAALK